MIANNGDIVIHYDENILYKSTIFSLGLFLERKARVVSLVKVLVESTVIIGFKLREKPSLIIKEYFIFNPYSITSLISEKI